MSQTVGIIHGLEDNGTGRRGIAGLLIATVRRGVSFWRPFHRFGGKCLQLIRRTAVGQPVGDVTLRSDARQSHDLDAGSDTGEAVRH